MTGSAKQKSSLPELVIRPEYEVADIAQAQINEVAHKLSLIERIWNINGVRKTFILLCLVAAWEAYTVGFDVEPLMLPSFSVSITTLYNALFHGDLIFKIWYSVKVLLIGYSAGLLIAAILILWATANRFGSDFIAMATAMFNPLPAIALLPLPLLWGKVIQIQLAYAIFGALFMPLLALTLLVMNNRGDWVGNRFRSGWIVNTILVLTVVYFAFAGIQKILSML